MELQFTHVAFWDRASRCVVILCTFRTDFAYFWIDIKFESIFRFWWMTSTTKLYLRISVAKYKSYCSDFIDVDLSWDINRFEMSFCWHQLKLFLGWPLEWFKLITLWFPNPKRKHAHCVTFFFVCFLFPQTYLLLNNLSMMVIFQLIDRLSIKSIVISFCLAVSIIFNNLFLRLRH